MGVQFYPIDPLICAYVGRFGFNIGRCSRLMVISACYRSLSKFFIRNYGSVDKSTEMKWYSNVMVCWSEGVGKP